MRMNNNDADWGVQHIERLLALAESLRALRVAVYHHEWYELAMGSPTTTPTNTLTAQAITGAIIQSPTGSIVAPESFPESSLFTVKIFAGGENTSFAFTISIFIGSAGSAPPCRHVPGLI